MTKARLFAAIALLSAMWVVAQQTPISQSQSQSTGADNQSAVIEGCLASSSGGGFTLTDQAGTAHLLAGASSELSNYLGQHIRVTGSERISTSTTDKSSPQSQGTFNVSKVEKISDTCSTEKK